MILMRRSDQSSCSILMSHKCLTFQVYIWLFSVLCSGTLLVSVNKINNLNASVTLTVVGLGVPRRAEGCRCHVQPSGCFPHLSRRTVISCGRVAFLPLHSHSQRLSSNAASILFLCKAWI